MNRENIQYIQSKDKSTHRPYATTVNKQLKIINNNAL